MANHGIIYTRLMASAEWRKIRNAQLYKSPYCEECAKKGRYIQAEVVHHITEVETGRTEEEQRSLAYAESNLQSLCRRCHTKIHSEKKSHSKKAHKERSAARLSAWLAAQKGEEVSTKEDGTIELQ